MSIQSRSGDSSVAQQPPFSARVTLVFHRLLGLVRKESLQIMRDPSALIIAFVLPPVMLFLFAFAISLDVKNVPFGVVLEGDGVHAQSLASAYGATAYLQVTPARDRREITRQLISGKLNGYVVIPADFDAQLLDEYRAPRIQIVTDGSSPNDATFVAAYAQGVFRNWLAAQGGSAEAGGTGAGIELQQRFWFNPELESRRVLIPGAIAIVMTLIGTLLTALVVSREWERGTMEAIMATPATTIEIIISKLLPYFCLGMAAIVGCTYLTVFMFGIPLRGSLGALLLVSSVFLVPALGQGLLISTLSRNQFQATLIATMTSFLPALFLGGFIFEIASMPTPVQWISQLIPARYYVASLQTIFLAGDAWSQLIRDMAGMLAVGVFFFSVILAKSSRGLD
jgi:ABC-2 type transport system permease protein